MKPQSGYNFMQQLNNFFSAYSVFITNKGEDICAGNRRQSSYIKRIME